MGQSRGRAVLQEGVSGHSAVRDCAGPAQVTAGMYEENLFSSSCVIYWMNGLQKECFGCVCILMPENNSQKVHLVSWAFFYTFPGLKPGSYFLGWGFNTSCRYQTLGAVNLCKGIAGQVLLRLCHTRLCLAPVLLPESLFSLHRSFFLPLDVADTSTPGPTSILPKR